MKQQLFISGGAVTLLLIAACGSATSAATSPTATAVPSIAPTATLTPTPTPIATSDPTATPTPTRMTPPPATGTTVSLRSVGGLGEILVGPNGRTLYLFLADSSMMSRCTGAGAH